MSSNGNDGAHMIATAQAEGRIVLIKDTQIMRRRVVTRGQLRAVLTTSSGPELQMNQAVDTLNLDCQFRPFPLYPECNQPLVERSKQRAKLLVSPYIFKTQSQYTEYPAHH